MGNEWRDLMDVKVKQLEWELRIGSSTTYGAETPFNDYIATITDENEGYWYLRGVTRGHKCDPDMAVVKAAAQADYEARVLSALAE
jgi:hypothetical protein